MVVKSEKWFIVKTQFVKSGIIGSISLIQTKIRHAPAIITKSPTVCRFRIKQTSAQIDTATE